MSSGWNFNIILCIIYISRNYEKPSVYDKALNYRYSYYKSAFQVTSILVRDLAAEEDKIVEAECRSSPSQNTKGISDSQGYQRDKGADESSGLI